MKLIARWHGFGSGVLLKAIYYKKNPKKYDWWLSKMKEVEFLIENRKKWKIFMKGGSGKKPDMDPT